MSGFIIPSHLLSTGDVTEETMTVETTPASGIKKDVRTVIVRTGAVRDVRARYDMTDAQQRGGSLLWSCHGRFLKEVTLLRQLIACGCFSVPGTPGI